MVKFHVYHLVDKSPWPLVNSFNLLNMMTSMIMIMKFNMKMNYIQLMMNLLLLKIMMFLWWRDIIRESSFQGCHTKKVIKGVKLAMMLFILSEIMFFFSFFWSYFYFSLAPEIELSNSWPPVMIYIFNPYSIPLLNTIILLTSGVTITCSHHYIYMKKINMVMKMLFVTILLGFIFSVFQLIEYLNSYFSINDSTYGTIFFMATGFHGVHVIIGTLFLITNLVRLNFSQMSVNHHLGFECSAWYWHFVDVIWVYLYIFFYWWFY